ncbi:PRC-barrel domain containing protein [Halomarina litorea]|uniref:PRC-barrel domain containing protein n=1 Tax=Halomarina litorea TaxID=2961595 RepID=UPI0020C243C0|nr:PRC-barrel domain containing protein [Halomarina sp. BCD28]
MDRIELTGDDEGKDVLSPDGQLLGRIARVEDGTATVETDPAADDPVLTQLGWANDSGETFPLQSQQVAEVTDDGVWVHDL